MIRWPCENPGRTSRGLQAPITTTWPMAENIYSKGTRVWFTDKDQGWISAEVTNVAKGSDDKIKLTFIDDRGKVSTKRMFFCYLRELCLNFRKSQLTQLQRLSEMAKMIYHHYETLLY